MSRYYVTCGKESAESKTPGVEPGKWESIENENKDQIKKLRNDLPLADDGVEIRRDNISLPSPWANVILFDSMINSTDKSFGTLQQKAITEWRALITLLALKDVLGIEVQFDTISLSDNYSTTEADVQFLRKMYEMKPLNGLFSHSWSEITFIKIDNISVGIITDSNIVCSAYAYGESTATQKLIDVGLMNNNYEFVDPTCRLKQDTVLSVLLANWLKCINKYISNINDSNRLSDLLGNFRNDLVSEQYISLLADNTDFITFTIRDMPIDNALDLIKAVNVSKIVIDIPEITNKIKIQNENEVYVLDFISKSFRNVYDAYEEYCQLPQSGRILGKDDIFMQNISFMEKRDTNGVESAQKEVIMLNNKDNVEVPHQMILPIREEVLNILPSIYIRDNILINCKNHDEYIEINITFYDMEHKPIQLTKKYYENEYNVIEEITNDIAIWPYVEFINQNNSEEKIWNEYYIYSNSVQYDDKTFEYQVKYDNLLINDVQIINWQKENNHEGGHPQVYCLKKIPTYLSVVSRDFGEIQKYGVLFLQKPRRYEVNKNKRCNVGVDFGTTSTTAFFQEDSTLGVEQFVSFSNEEREIDINLKNNGKYIVSKFTDNVNNFLNEKYPKRMSYPSLIEHQETGNESFLICEEPFKWGNIIYNQVDAIENPRVMRNMKWGKDDDSKNAIESYLGQITKMIAFKLACLGYGCYIWKFSYPTSLSRKMTDAYRARTGRMVESINKLNLSSQLDTNGAFYSESIVSAKFYKYTSNYICVDIGGGSTDVSIWKGIFGNDNVANILQFSVGIASRKIFLKAFADLLISSENNDIQNNFVKIFCDALNRCEIPAYAIETKVNKIRELKQLGKLKKEDYNDFVYCIEPGILTVGNDVKDLIFQSNRDKSNKFFKTIIVGLWGLLYYTAISVGQVKEKFEDEESIRLYFAGTGSKMYSWVEDEYGGVIKEAFEKVLNKVLYEDYAANKIRVEFKYSEEDLKTEAARGLLRMDKADERDSIANIFLMNCGKIMLKAKDSNLPEDIVVGENENVCTNEYVNSFFSPSNDKKISAIEIKFNPDDKNDDFIQYINIMNEMFFDSAEDKIELKTIDRISLNRKIKDVIEENKNNHTVASAFIVKLEALVEYLRDC